MEITENNIQKKDYVRVVYNSTERPLTTYPQQLAHYLAKRFQMRPGEKILDMGCGRGEFLKGFSNCSLEAHGVDRSDAAKELNPNLEIRLADLEKDALPYANNSFDYIYSKSVVEHFYYPEKIFQEMYRVLRPGGQVITLTPDWETIYKIFYEDYTHRTPFTKNSLKDIHLIHGFEQVEVEKFLQLPEVWSKPWISGLCFIVRKFVPDAFKSSSKFIRFSKEVMLLSSAKKPGNKS